MSWDFFKTTERAAAKPHRCEQCHKPIDKGQRHVYCAGKFDSHFMDYREHVECREAWNELNFEIRDGDHFDGAAFLADDEHEAVDRQWMVNKYPVVAERLGWAKSVEA